MGLTNSSWPPLNYNNNSSGGGGDDDDNRAQMDHETMHHYVPDKLLWTLLMTSPLRYQAKSLVINTHTCAIHTQKSRKQKLEQNCWEFLTLLHTNSQFLPQHFHMTDCDWLLPFLYEPTTFFFYQSQSTTWKVVLFFFFLVLDFLNCC